ncbi:MAG: FprA family A-type flavoprotein [Clostridia bacterium]|nr:FprA family A-type flavoprotein [Clostridia bacterium]
MKITNDIKYVGVNDHNIDLFEGQFKVPEGMAYNSYVVIDEKVAVFDTVDQRFGEEWLKNIKDVLGERTVDYLIVQHMEPDHSANIARFMEEYPSATVVATQKAITMMPQFFGEDFAPLTMAVKDGDTLTLGKHSFTFVTAPMVHWPEVMLTYEGYSKVLFSADAFGKFGALDVEADWACEARRYYFGIVGKFGVQVQALLKKAAGLEIQTICPLHGPVLSENLSYYLNLYDIWSSYRVEEEGVVINYTSVYGNTGKAVEMLAEKLKESGCSKVVVNDLARCDIHEAIEDTFRYSKAVFATTTYNGSIFPFMYDFIHHLTERNFQNRKVAFIENGTWAPTAIKTMKALFESSKNLEFAQTEVSIKSAPNDKNIKEIEDLAKELAN